MKFIRRTPTLLAALALVGLVACTPETTAEVANGPSSSSGDVGGSGGMMPDPEPMDEPAAPFALVEIFTSEG